MRYIEDSNFIELNLCCLGLLWPVWSKVFVRIGGDKLAACKDIEQHTVVVDGDEAQSYSEGLRMSQVPI